jgi:hypothetical protein
MIVYGSEEGMQFIKDARELEERGLAPRIRLYRMSSDGLNVLAELTVRTLRYRNISSVEDYAIDECGDGYYCAKLFSTQYGRNILESTFDFIVEDDEDDE